MSVRIQLGDPDTGQTWVQQAQYNAAGQATGYVVTAPSAWETWSFQYNVRGQLTREKAVSQTLYATVLDTEFRYSTAANDGRIAQQKDWVSGEEVNYQYDELGRLIAAATTGPQWGLSWTYDGFGNRLSQNVTKGTGPVVSLSISAATNRITTEGFAYDAAGHMTQWPGGTVTLGADYDVEGRLSVVKEDGAAKSRYSYDAQNRRVKWVGTSSTTPKYEVYGPGGELLGVYGWYWPLGAPSAVFRVEEERIYFAGRVAARLDETGSPNFGRMDQLGSVKAWQRYPFGEGNESSANDEYATYPIDRSTGHYYAWNRFYSATWGRFSSPDLHQNGARMHAPQSWNAYTYTQNDPVNRTDPTGLVAVAPGYCPPEHTLDECDRLGYTRGPSDGPSIGGPPMGGGWTLCPNGPGFLPNPLCELPFLPVIAAPREEESKPECFAQLKDRPVHDPKAAKFKAVHTFWWVQDRTGTQYIISAGPTKVNSSGTQYLNVSVTQGNDNGSGDSSRAHTHWNSGLSWIICEQVDAMVAAAKYWQSSRNNSIVYHPVGVLGIGGPNSSSAAHYFGVVSGFNPSPPTTAYGWWSPIVFP